MLRPLASIWDIAVPPTAIPTTVDEMVAIVTTVTIVIIVIVTVAGVFLVTTRTVIVILMAVITVNATVTAIGAGAPLLVVIRPIFAGVGVIPEAHPEAVALLVLRPRTTMLPRTPIIGKLAFYVYMALCSRAWYLDERLWRDKVEVLQTRRVSVSKSNPKFAFLSVHTTIVRKVTS
jgi:hypothetical protein